METNLSEVPADLRQRRDAILNVIDELGSQKELAGRIGINESRLSKALSDEMISDRRLAPIERAISKKELWVGQRVSVEKESQLAYLPLANVSASGGDGAEVFEHEIEAFMGYDARQLRRELGVNPSSLIIMPVTGNSMEPTATPGDRLWVMKYSGEPVLDGAIYVFRREYSGVIVKRVYWNEDGSLFLKGDNPDGGPSMTIQPGDEADWKVIGRVLRVEKNL